MHFFPQPPDVDHHRVVGIEVFLAPGLFKQLLAGQHPPPVFAQQPQQVEFDGGQYQGLIVQGAGVGLPVDDQPVEIDDRGFLRPLVVPGGPAQLGLDPRHHLQRAEGLGDVVVGPDGQAGDLIQLLHLGGQHDHRKPVALPDAPADGEAVHVGQHHVQQRQIDFFRLQGLERVQPRVAGVHRESLVGQVQLHQIGDFLLVVHHQYVHGSRLRFFGFPPHGGTASFILLLYIMGARPVQRRKRMLRSPVSVNIRPDSFTL